MDNLTNKIIKKINLKEEITPFLFIGEELESINNEVFEICKRIGENFGIDKNYINIFKNKSGKIKVEEIKFFLEKIFIKSNYEVQFFIIENIGNMTEKAANSCLKIFEEPQIGNLIFLTNTQETNILDTIISRCTIIYSKEKNKNKKNEFYYSLIDDYIRNKNLSLASYLYKEKLKKFDYINLLDNFILYFKENKIFLDLIGKINEDINLIQNNNLLAKYVVDKYLMKIK